MISDLRLHSLPQIKTWRGDKHKRPDWMWYGLDTLTWTKQSCTFEASVNISFIFLWNMQHTPWTLTFFVTVVLVIWTALVVLDTVGVTATLPAALEGLTTTTLTWVLCSTKACRLLWNIYTESELNDSNSFTCGAHGFVVLAALSIKQAAVVALARVASVVLHATSFFTAVCNSRMKIQHSLFSNKSCQ